MGFIIKPVVIEKMTKLTGRSSEGRVVKHKSEKGIVLARPRCGPIVKSGVNRLEIKKEAEALYNVTVVDVNTTRYASKRQARYTGAGLAKGQRDVFKKTIVTLKSGDPIDFYSNI